MAPRSTYERVRATERWEMSLSSVGEADETTRKFRARGNRKLINRHFFAASLALVWINWKKTPLYSTESRNNSIERSAEVRMAESQRMFRLKMKNKRFARGAICMTCKSNLLAMPKHTNSNNIQFLALHTKRTMREFQFSLLEPTLAFPPKPYNLHRSWGNIVNEQKKNQRFKSATWNISNSHFEVKSCSGVLQPVASCRFDHIHIPRSALLCMLRFFHFI